MIKIQPSNEVGLQIQLFLAPKGRLQPSTNHECREFSAGGEMCFADLHFAHLKHMVIFFYKISLA